MGIPGAALTIAAAVVLPEDRLRAQTPFTEEAATRGVDYSTHPLQFNDGSGRGLAFVDLDRDGDPDLVAVGRTDGVVGVWENDGTGHFIDRAPAAGIPLLPVGVATPPAPLPGPSGVTAADYDGDGDLDVYISVWMGPNRLLRNEGGFSFTEVADAAGVADPGAGTGCAWSDFDGDGWLDLYVPNYTWSNTSTIRNRLYRNLGDGTFEEVSSAHGVDDSGFGFQAVFFDMDLDGDGDLYLSNDKSYDCDGVGPHNHLFRNDAGAFTEITDTSGTSACIDSMGVAVGDFDLNGWPDLYCTNIPEGNPLFLNQGDETFIDASEAWGVGSYAIGWAAMFLDYDNDGFEDLYVCNDLAANRLYAYVDTAPCVDVAPAAGVADAGRSFCLAVADVDIDGDLDLVVQNAGEPLRLYINHEGEQDGWIRFCVAGRGHDPFGVGAVVRVRSGVLWRFRQVAAGHNYKSQNELVLHFGLGADAIDAIEVTWPGGVTRTLAALPKQCTWTLYPPEHLGDGDGDGVIGLADFFDLLACVGPLAAGCEMHDIDGDGAIDGDDLAAWLTLYDGPARDCDGNGEDDLVDVFEGVAADANGNGVLDGCEAAGDVNGDAEIDVDDLVLVILNWGPCGLDPCFGDATLDGVVGVDDLVAVIVGWSPS